MRSCLRLAYNSSSHTDQSVQHSSRYNHAKEDEDVDELAGTSLLDAHDLEKAGAKPLPPLPSLTRPQGMDESGAKRQVLAVKSTNTRLGKKTRMLPAKSQISPPILISSSTDPFRNVAGLGPSTTTDEAHVGRRILALQQQADAQAAETREKERRLAAIDSSSRPSPLQRGKSVFMTAKHAIASRLGSPRMKFGRRHRTLSGLEYESIGKISETASSFDRPLPVYESMRTRRETTESLEEGDPFSDTMETDEVWSDFDFDLDRTNIQRDNVNTGKSRTPSVEDPTGEELLVRPETPKTFSNKVSGLRQHPDPEFFSSSPLGFSTPRVRLVPTRDENGRKRLSTVLVRDPSVLDFSHEHEPTDAAGDPLVLDYSEVDPSSSTKRKSATEDLRLPGSKRAKTDSATSKETTVLAQGFDQLGTSDSQAMEEGNPESKAISKTGIMPGSKGFGIFDMGKGQEVEASVQSSTGYSSIRRHSRAFSTSSSRPTSVLFSRETRARVPLLKTYQDDQMDVDELQTSI
ncbi:MAG: hypothetical protein LQ346_000040 [Caloplaca aetnensis]|nr:MAG: hypothetical protein LQ346_000040 [Caloplaca aetnensis]